MKDAAPNTVKTRILIVSDTHGGPLSPTPVLDDIDVLVHCGDLTEESKLQEFKDTIEFIKQTKAKLKLVIAGNHDLVLDEACFEKQISDFQSADDKRLVEKVYGSPSIVRQLFEDAKEHGIILLDEGNYTFNLSNGATLKVYASPYTSSNESKDWAFSYLATGEHTWAIAPDTDLVITHSPPHGVLDLSAGSVRYGSKSLFRAVAAARPRLHCFGHIHRSWGAKMVAWHPTQRCPAVENLNHFNAIDNKHSISLGSLRGIALHESGVPMETGEQRKSLEDFLEQGFVQTCHGGRDAHPLVPGQHTLFVNAAIQGVSEERPMHLPWLVEMDLPMTPT